MLYKIQPTGSARTLATQQVVYEQKGKSSVQRRKLQQHSQYRFLDGATSLTSYWGQQRMSLTPYPGLHNTGMNESAKDTWVQSLAVRLPVSDQGFLQKPQPPKHLYCGRHSQGHRKPNKSQFIQYSHNICRKAPEAEFNYCWTLPRFQCLLEVARFQHLFPNPSWLMSGIIFGSLFQYSFILNQIFPWIDNCLMGTKC